MEGGSSSKELAVTLLFTVKDESGTLSAALEQFRLQSVCLTRIESRPSRSSPSCYDIITEFHATSPSQVQGVMSSLKAVTLNVEVISDEPSLRFHRTGTPLRPPPPCAPFMHIVDATPWFPRKLVDLDLIANKVLECGEELTADHPGFTDVEYRRRRQEITTISKTFRT